MALNKNYSENIYPQVNEAWKSTCKIMLGEDVGELKDFGSWLSDYIELPYCRKSSISGKNVAMSIGDYNKNAKYAGMDEIAYNKSMAALDINQIKDIDSVIQAIKENIVYTGNVILGNSSNVEASTDIIDSHFIYESSLTSASKYVSHSRYINYSEYCFGQYGAIKSAMAIKCSGSKFIRAFECHSSELLNDCYYCGSMQNSTDCIFSFGARGRKFLIGNLQLTKDRYMELKKKLVGEIAQKLKKDKKIYSLFSILQECRKYAPEIQITVAKKEEKFDIAPIQSAFSKTTKILFGEELGEMEDYADYLYSHVPANVLLKSPFGGTALIAGYRKVIGEIYQLEGRFVTDSQVQRISDFAIEEENTRKLDASSLESVCKNIHKIAYSDLDKVVGNNQNVKGSAVTIDAQDSYMGSANIRCKQCAYSFWPDSSESIFGSYVTWESAFCLKCYNSKKIQRCFEVSDARDCSDCYFSHNIENCTECILCFNAKNIKYSIGNVQYPKEEYLRLKKILLKDIFIKLKKNKKLKMNIFNIGSASNNAQ